VLAATDGSIASATVLFEYLASHGLVVIAVPSRLEYASLQVSRPNVVVEARVRDLEFLLDHARRYAFVDTSRIAALGVNFDGMAALAFQMKNMAVRAIVSLDGWEGKENSTATVTGGLHYDPRRLRVPYLIVLQDEQPTPPGLRLDRTIFDAMQYSERQWLVLRSMSHAYLVGNPLAYPGIPPDKRRSYELLVRGIHGFLASALGDSARLTTSVRTPFVADWRGTNASPDVVKDLVRATARPAVPDDAELERLIMVDRAVDKVASILREGRRTDSNFTLFSEQRMGLYAFRFARQNDVPFAIRLLELNAEAFPRSWSAADALGNGYTDAADTTRALTAFTRALGLLTKRPPRDTSSLGELARARQAIEEKIAKLRSRSSSPGRGRPAP
jgi:dienelactone hydrolase